ncbi:PPOX class F420-dependent oxidoreductase [Dactylosporangium sp. CS-033363]|uniref:PPOX class F420-dependent oxidoreductase n=1 Tax=Dactylosporangium sp. CS-033363 TaxID=3239935 RepID=UPI003D923B7B
MLEADVRRVLDGTPLAHVATVDADGAPHSSPVWIGTDGDAVVFFTGPDSRKARNLRHDPRVAVSIATPDNPYQPVIVRGRVTRWIGGDEGWAMIDRVAAKYTGGPYDRSQERIIAVIEPDHQKIGLG